MIAHDKAVIREMAWLFVSFCCWSSAVMADVTTVSDYSQVIENPEPAANDNFGSQVAATEGYIAVFAAGDDAAAADLGRFYLFDPETDALIRAFDPLVDPTIYEFHALAADGNYLVLGSYNYDPAERVVRIYAADSGIFLRSLQPPAGASFSVSRRSDVAPLYLQPQMLVDVTGENVVVNGMADAPGCDEQQPAVFVYDAGTGDLLHQLSDPNSTCESFFARSLAAEGQGVVVGVDPGEAFSGYAEAFSSEGMAFIYDLESGELVRRLTTEFPYRQARFVAMSDSLILLSDGSEVLIFDRATKLLLRRLKNPAESVYRELDFGYYGYRFATQGNLVAVWAGLASGSEIGRIDVFHALTGEALYSVFNPGASDADAFGVSGGSGTGFLVNGKRLFAGAYRNGNVNAEAGRVYAFELDADADEMPDAWELNYGLDPEDSADALLDPDADGLLNADEFRYGGDPGAADTDADGLADGDEALIHGSFVFASDSDRDDLDDALEVLLGTNPVNADTDGDTMPDGYERNHGLDPTRKDGAKDLDGDGLANRREFNIQTKPNNADTDSDGVNDRLEKNRYKTNPLNPDTDGDGLRDGREVNWLGTDPRSTDTDGDGLRDGVEVKEAGTNPLSRDTDGDTMDDQFEYSKRWLNPLKKDGAKDYDKDGITNRQEYNRGTRQADSDTDNDGVLDGDEVNIYGTNPRDEDTDGDLMPDRLEIEFGYKPRNARDGERDDDDDGIPTGVEVAFGFDPFDADTDDDGREDGREIIYECPLPDYIYDYEITCWWLNRKTGAVIVDLDGDPDEDGLSNREEIYSYRTDPLNSDSDGDGMSDSWEVDGGLNPTQKDGGTDFDNDGLSAKREFKWRTDPRNADTDGDNVSDGDEVAAGTNPRRADTN